MAIPNYYEMHRPFLEALKDGNAHSIKEITGFIAHHFQLTEDDMAKKVPCGKHRVVANRITWSRTCLAKAGLIESSGYAMYKITESGQDVLKSGPDVIDRKYLLQFESFRDFSNASSVEEGGARYSPQDNSDDESKTPDETMEEAFGELNAQLADDILSEVANLSPSAFEQMAIDLLLKMGYGAFENAGNVTAPSHDNGIDGIIMEDRLGFSLIYIQAKKWDIGSTVGRPELQKFAGAIAGRNGKGLFITTAKFSQDAVEYAERQHIILIDGKKLARLMIDCNFGARIDRVYEIKSVDSDIFNSYMGG